MVNWKRTALYFERNLHMRKVHSGFIAQRPMLFHEKSLIKMEFIWIRCFLLSYTGLQHSVKVNINQYMKSSVA